MACATNRKNINFLLAEVNES